MSKSSQRKIPWGWIGFFGVLVLLALLSAAALLKGGKELSGQQAPVTSEPAWRIIVHGEVHLLDEEELKRFEARLKERLGGRFKELHADSDALIDREVARVFAPVYEAIPIYADWYYSLTGEYLRLGHALGSGMLSYMEEKLREILFDQTGMEAALSQLPGNLQAEVAGMIGQAGEELLAELSAELPQGEAGAPGQEGERWELAGELPLDELVGEELQPSGDLLARQLFSLGAGAGAGVLVAKGGAAVLVKKVVANVAAGKSFQLAAGLAGKLAAKSAAKGGSALAGAGTGALICSPGGPLALICGAAAGLATWILVDKVALEVDEHLNRQEMEAEIRQAIEAEEEALRESLKRLYASWLKTRLESFMQRASTTGGDLPGYRPIDQLPVSDRGAGEEEAVLRRGSSSPR